MNFEGFQHLIMRIAKAWYKAARKEFPDFESIHDYLQDSPFTAKQTPANEEAYERLMDVRMKLYDLSREIDVNHDSYMEFMQQTLDCPDLMQRVVGDCSLEEKHLVHLELMIIEQVADWELDSGKAESGPQWSKSHPLVVLLPNGTTRTLSISQDSQRRHWFGTCAVSSKIGDLKICTGCKVVGYIGKDEQRDDWPRHKPLCNILKVARGDTEHWTARISAEELLRAMESGLGRPLEQYERDVADHPRVCVVCRQGADQSSLRNCRGCFCVAFCPDHQEQGKTDHDKHCQALRTAAEDYRIEVTLGHQVQGYTPKITKAYGKLEGNIEAFFAPDVAGIVSRKLPGYQESELRYLTFLYTCPLTVLFGMQESLPDLAKRRDLTVHLLGVRRAEMRNLRGWEILACQLPALRKLHLHFIGDESPVDGENFPAEFTYKGKDLQAERSNDLEVRYFFPKPVLYQDYARSSSYCVPDLVVALDCGFKFYPSWQPALKLALKAGSPIVFTEFNEQDQRDNLAILERLGELEVIVQPRKNDWCSARPVRCSDRTGNYQPFSVIYTNDYICVVRSKGLAKN